MRGPGTVKIVLEVNPLRESRNNAATSGAEVDNFFKF